MAEQERIYLVVDKSDDCGTEIELIDSPAFAIQDKYIDGVRRIVDGTIVLAVKEHTILHDEVKYTRKLEDIMRDRRLMYVKWLKEDAKDLREVKLRGDKDKGELHFTCLEQHRFGIIQKLKSIPTWVELIKITNQYR